MDVQFVTHPAFMRHETGSWHPERPARLEAVERGAVTSGLAVHRLEAPAAERDDLLRIHSEEYVESIREFCANGGGSLDPDTVAGKHSWEAAVHAAGAGPAAVEALRGAVDSVAFLAVRPPGHHALRDRAMGFCLFNNIAVTAARLRAQEERVAIVDWDVHHGNGTQDAFAGDGDVLYVSLHQWPFYPGTGSIEDVGEGEAVGTVLNLPMPAGTGGDVYREAFGRLVVPILEQFTPDWILVSCGFDAHQEDPLAEMRLVTSDYGAMAGSLRALVPPSRTLLFLEGGYHLPAVTSATAATLRGLAGMGSAGSPSARPSPELAWRMLDAGAAVAARHWDVG